MSRSLVALDHNSTIIAVVELSQSSWLVGGVLPGIERLLATNGGGGEGTHEGLKAHRRAMRYGISAGMADRNADIRNS